MRTIFQALWAAGLSSIVACVALQAHAQDSAPTAEELAAEIQAIKQEYEARIQALEGQLKAMTTAPARPAAQAPASPIGQKMPTTDNVFNPAIGLILDARFSNLSSEHDFEPAGFQLGHGSERPPEGLALGHPELTLSGNVDDKFFGAATIAIDAHPGEAVALEVEELYIQTLPGAGLPDGARIRGGRALWTFGYLNEVHLHADDFADRPLPYRVFLHEAFNDDGLELSYVLPTDIYAEVGGGLYRGADFPFANSENGTGAWSAYARIGGDVGNNAAWRIGAYMLAGEAHNRPGDAHGHGHEEDAHEGEHDQEEGDDHAEDEHHDDDGDDHAEDEHHDDDGDDHAEEHDEAMEDIEAFTAGMFSGDAAMYAIDGRFTWAPTGNPREQELILQAEVFWRVEDGEYHLVHEDECDEHGVCPEHEVTFNEATSMGYYVQGVYKLNRNIRVGARYARLDPPDILELDHEPVAYAVMADWTNSEFSRIRLQYNREEIEEGEPDDQILFQYIMSLGAHAAHTF